MLMINKRQTTLAGDKMGLVTEASALGLVPGEWPGMVAVLDDANEGFLFQGGYSILGNGELQAYKYYTRDGNFSLTIFND